MKSLVFALFAAGTLAAAAPAFAQGACSLTPAQVEANKKTALGFFRPGVTPDERVAMVDPGYVQHNPRFKKYAQDNHLSDYDGFKAMLGQLRAAPAGGPAAAQPAPPPGDPQAVVMADCDLVTVLHKTMRPDPTKPGGWYEAFTFDTFRVKNGKLVEHWDDAVIPPPAAG